MIDLNLMKEKNKDVFSEKTKEFRADVMKMLAEMELRENKEEDIITPLGVKIELNTTKEKLEKDLLIIDISEGLFIFKEKLVDMISVVMFEDVKRIKPNQGVNLYEINEGALKCIGN